jgi:7-carboxy-7-deazaguanine synthase
VNGLKLSQLSPGMPEIFESIQGEGVSVGLPCVFVRLAICNLHCGWCDTRYTWDWRSYRPRDQILEMPVADVVASVLAKRAQNIVITGGEPLLQMAAVEALATDLRLNGRRIEVETNGTVAPSSRLRASVSQWNVSPKLANAGDSPEMRLRQDALGLFAQEDNVWFKFVVCEACDLDEVDSLVRGLNVPASRVIVMPEGRDEEAVRRRSVWLVAAALERGYRFSSRLHVLLWGAERGR